MSGPISDHAKLIEGKALGPPRMPRRGPLLPPATKQTLTPARPLSGPIPPPAHRLHEKVGY
jgi:hypothetical protein